MLIKVNAQKLYQIEFENVKAKRSYDYSVESDPLFFKYQRGEATREEWEAKIEEIRQRHPYPEEV